MRRTAYHIVLALVVWVPVIPPVAADNVVPARPPEAPVPKPPAMPAPYIAELGNGLEVIVVRNDRLPYVTVGWQLLAGARFDPPDKAGVAALTADLLRQGTKTRSAMEMAEQLDFLAVQLSGSAGHETTVVYAGALEQYLDTAVELMADTIRNPVFPQDEFDRKVAEAKSGLAIAEQTPEYQVRREFDRRVFGEHYLSRPAEGTTESLARISREEVARFHGKYYVPNNSTLIFSGAVTSERALALARQHFGDWPKGELPAEPAGKIPELAPVHVYLVDWPDASQSQIRVGQRGIKRTDPDYEAAQVFNQVFGGGFSGRLMKSIRSEKGLTYGARGGFQTFKNTGAIYAQTFTRNEKTAEALRTVLAEFEKIRNEPATDKELKDGRNYLMGSFGTSMETPQDVAGKILDLRSYGLPDDYYTHYLANVARTSAQDVQELARARIHPDKLVIVVVGRADELEASLKDFGPVTIIRKGGK